MGILDSLAKGQSNNAATATVQAPANGGRTDRKPSEFWLNIGANIVGGGEDGEDLFVSLPSGLPLDDMKPVKVTGSNPNSIQLKQVKNLLLEELQKMAAEMKPGERRDLPLTVQVYRVAQPDQTGTADNNPLIAGLFAAMGGKK